MGSPGGDRDSGRMTRSASTASATLGGGSDHHSSRSSLFTQQQHAEGSSSKNSALGGPHGDPVYESHIQPLLPQKSEDAPDFLTRKLPNLHLRRMAAMEGVLRQAQGGGIEMKDRKKMFKVYPRAFIASDLSDWIFLNCGFLTREEALRYCQTLFSEGYIIPVDLAEKFTADGSMYIFQSEQLWASRLWSPSDFDYTVYLVKRSMRVSAKYLLHEWEEDRLLRLQDAFYQRWEEVESNVNSHMKHMKSTLSKQERRIFQLQEYTFWKVHRPFLIQAGQSANDEDRKNKESRNAQEMEEYYESNLRDEALLDYLEKRVEILNLSFSMNRVKISQSCKTLVQRCDVWRPLDPILEPGQNIPNPWFSEESSILTLGTANNVIWNSKKHPSTADIRMWTYSFTELMRDAMGVKHFYNFVQKEFSQENLEFYLKCQALDSIPTRKDFTERARSIYDEFIKINAPREININSAERTAIINQFESTEADSKRNPLSYYVFADALKHIFALMAKDTYVRFCNSEVVSKAMSEALEREQASGQTSVAASTAEANRSTIKMGRNQSRGSKEMLGQS
ncbi:hypothetical protein DFS34DRAFT_235793 [Phlyctochytrium arcticum]|nr:hypothetical protein DFS34DRAFT_235793 [Phlyctochytrium arcticum]